MNTKASKPAGDPTLAPFLEARTDADARDALEALLSGETDGLIGEIVRRELAGSRAWGAHVDDVAADVRVRLIRKLWSLRQGAGEPVENLLAYTATAAAYGCHTFLRQQYPERTRFRNRVRYAVAHHPRTSLTQDANGLWRCQTREAVRRAPAAGATQRFLDDPRAWLASTPLDIARPLPEFLSALLPLLDRAIELDRLVDALANVLGIADLPSQHRGVDRRGLRGSLMDAVTDPAPSVGTALEQRQVLLAAWTEIAKLPKAQRAALLLNLRDADGGATLHMLPSTGVASAMDIAAALEIDAHALTSLWDRLPLDDLAIAARLGVTRQQVINLRKSARARLSRRLREAIE